MKQAILSNSISWHDIEAPAAEELAQVVRELELLPADAEFLVRGHARPEITIRPHYISLLIAVPIFLTTTRVTRGVPLFLLIKDQQLITLHDQPIVVLQKIIQEFQANPDTQADGFGETALSLAFHLVTELNEASFHKLHRLQKHIDIAEDAVFAGNERKMVEEITILSRDVMDFRKVIRPQKELFKTPLPETIDEESRALWIRLDGQSQKLWETLEGIFESVKDLGHTNASLLQHKENELLRLLSFYSIISVPAFLLMNAFNPQISNLYAPGTILFLILFTFFILALIVIFFRFKRKRVL